MPRFAPTVPHQIYYGLQRDNTFGDYHLLLAHDVVKHPNDYGFLFNSPLAYTRNRVVILDNSVVELGQAVDLNMILEAAKIVRPTCTVLPDVMLDANATMDSCLKALPVWAQAFFSEGLEPSFMMLPQGKTFEEWIMCAEEFINYDCITWWGIPRNVVAQDIGTRIGLPSILKALNPKRKIHMFGFSDNVPDDVMAVKMNRDIVEGIDSAVPVRAVTHGIPCSMVSFCSMPKRGDWWETAEYHPEMATYVRTMNQWFE